MLPRVNLLSGVIFVALHAANAEAEQTTVVVGFGSIPGYFQEPGARGIYDEFLGGWRGADSLGDFEDAGGFSFGGPGSEISIEIRHEIGPLWQMRFQVAHGTAQYDLPEGVDIFTDPARISVRYASIAAELSRSIFTFDLFDRPGEITAGLGYFASRLDTRFRSALLDVRNSVNVVEGVFRLGAEWSLVPAAVGVRGIPLVGGDFRLYESGTMDFRVSLRARF